MSIVPVLNSAPKIFKNYPFGVEKGEFAIRLAPLILNLLYIEYGSYAFGNKKDGISMRIAPITTYLPPKIIASYAFGNRKDGISICIVPHYIVFIS